MRRVVWTLIGALALATTAAAITSIHALKQAQDVFLVWDTPGEWSVLETSDLSIPFREVGRTTGNTYVVPNALAGPPRLYWRVASISSPGESSWNLAWKLSFPIVDASPPEPDRTAISLPYWYWPTGNVSVTRSTARDFCNDNPGVGAISRMACDRTLVTQNCASSKAAFNLAVGEAYFVTPAAPSMTLHLVGSDNAQYNPRRGGVARVSAAPCAACSDAYGIPVAVPPTTLSRTAEELCRELALQGQQVLRISDPRPGSQWTEHVCGTSPADFALEPGKGYWLVATGPFQWGPVAW